MKPQTDKQRGAMFRRLNKGGQKPGRPAPVSRSKAPEGVVRKALEAAGIQVQRIGNKKGEAGEYLRVAVVGQCVPKDAKGSLKIDSPEYAHNEELRRRTIEAIVSLRPGKDPISVDDAKASIQVEVIEPKEE